MCKFHLTVFHEPQKVIFNSPTCFFLTIPICKLGDSKVYLVKIRMHKKCEKSNILYNFIIILLYYINIFYYEVDAIDI